MRLRISRRNNVKGPPWSIENADGSSLHIPVWRKYHFTHRQAVNAADLILGRIDVREYHARNMNVKPRSN